MKLPVVFALAFAASAQLPVSPVVHSTAVANTAAPLDVLPAQRIGSDDLISLQVSDLPELSRSFRVSSDGTLALPLLGHRIQAAGMMPVDLEDAIAHELAKQNILVDPVVSVAVAEYRSHPVNVIGAVKSPLTFQAMADTTLIDAIAKAGGLDPEAGPVILLSRKQVKPDGAVETSVQRIPVKGLMDAADPSLNVVLHGGEEVRVPEVGKIFVAGNVRTPGAFPMQDNSDTTLLKALALSQGTLPYTQKVAYIYRKDPAGNKRTEIPVELSSILARKSPDITVLPDDIIYIPENHGKKLAGAALDRIAGTAANVAPALTYRAY
jgi:polysaccharide export outer membrane protein